MATADKDLVILFNPRPQILKLREQWVPLAVICLGGPLEQRGYRVVIVDEKMEDDHVAKILSLAPEALCLGITAMTGFQIRSGIDTAQVVRERFPDLPIIWGGWHPSLEPYSTVQHPLVDAVVRGQGEDALPEACDRLREGKSFEGVMGTYYKEDGQVVENPCRPFKDPNLFPPYAYHLIDVEKYAESAPLGAGQDLVTEIKGRRPRSVSYMSSIGCPWNCNFCSVEQVSGRKWWGLRAERVVDDMATLQERYAINSVFFEDNNFFVDTKRVRAICEGLIGRKVDIKWWAAGRGDQFLKFDHEMMCLLRDGGMFQAAIGAESGNDEVLKKIRKKARAADTLEAVKWLGKYGIAPHLSYIIGYPEESEQAMWDTLRQMGETRALYEETRTHFGLLSPYPGTDQYDIAIQHGLLQPPKSLEEWANFHHNADNMGIIGPKTYRRLRRWAQFYNRYAFPAESYRRRMARGPIRGLPYTLLHKAAHLRYQKHYLGFMIEPWLVQQARKLRAIAH